MSETAVVCKACAERPVSMIGRPAEGNHDTRDETCYYAQLFRIEREKASYDQLRAERDAAVQQAKALAEAMRLMLRQECHGPECPTLYHSDSWAALAAYDAQEQAR